MVHSISILGCTGSIGRQTVDVAEHMGMPVAALAASRSVKLLEEQARRLKPKLCAVYDESAARDFKIAVADTDIKVVSGIEGLIEAATLDAADCVVTAVSGAIGLKPTLAAIDARKRIALANKETLVCAGELVMRRAKERGAEIVPVDSEHSAIFQCLMGRGAGELKKLLLTGSGGPFRGIPRAALEDVTPAQAVKHPNWKMGAKISVDSATMMNKGLEVIEARWLFDVEAEKIQILVHPQSIVHSAVEFMDNSVIAQLGVPDMRIPISLALGYPDRLKNGERELDFFGEGSNLTFEKPNPEVFGCISLAYEAIARGGSCPAVMNAANEVLVAAFLEEKIRFVDIEKTLACILDAHKTAYNLDLEGILEIDKETRKLTREIL